MLEGQPAKLSCMRTVYWYTLMRVRVDQENLCLQDGLDLAKKRRHCFIAHCWLNAEYQFFYFF